MPEEKKLLGCLIPILCAVIGAVATIYAAYVPIFNRDQLKGPNSSTEFTPHNRNGRSNTGPRPAPSATPDETEGSDPLSLDEYLAVVCRGDATSLQRSEAERKFKGSRVRLQGQVRDIGRNQPTFYGTGGSTGPPVLVMTYNYAAEDGADRLIYFCRTGTVSVTFSEQDATDLSRLRIGQPVEVVGTFQNFSGTSFSFSKGTLVKY
jgi:hypothetical protein